MIPQYFGSFSEENNQFADKESRKSDPVYDLLKKMIDSNGSGMRVNVEILVGVK